MLGNSRTVPSKKLIIEYSGTFSHTDNVIVPVNPEESVLCAGQDVWCQELSTILVILWSFPDNRLRVVPSSDDHLVHLHVAYPRISCQANVYVTARFRLEHKASLPLQGKPYLIVVIILMCEKRGCCGLK